MARKKRGGRGSSSRRRAIVLLALAIACGGLAVSEVRGRERETARRTGPLVPVVVVRSGVAAGKEMTPGRARAALAVRKVPAGFVPRDALGSPGEAVGLRTAVALEPGAYLAAGMLKAARPASGGRRPGGVAPGERAVEVAVSGGAAGVGASRVDVLVTTEGRDGGDSGRTYVALQDVEVLASRPGGAAGDPAGGGDRGPGGGGERMLVTLRVTARQAVFLTAAENFAREIRLLARPPGDERRLEQTPVESSGL